MRNLLMFQFCAKVIDDPPKLSEEFDIIPISISAVADSWKKFIQVVTRHCNELIETPGKTAFPILESLVTELSTPESSNKELFLCDVYRIYLTTWKRLILVIFSKYRWRMENENFFYISANVAKRIGEMSSC